MSSLSPQLSVLGTLLLSLLLLATVGCGGGSDEQPLVAGDVVPLTATVNRAAATGSMTLELDQESSTADAVKYQVVRFQLFSQQLRLSGEGTADTITFDRRVTLTIDAMFGPPNEEVHLVGQGFARSIVPLRFTDLRLTGQDVEVVLSTDQELAREAAR